MSVTATRHGWRVACDWLVGCSRVTVLHNEHVDEVRDTIAERGWTANGVDVTTEPLVGLGTVCRRQDTSEGYAIVSALASAGVSLHGFGVKLTGLARYGALLSSADSLAWSYNARRNPPLPGCVHDHCASCPLWARQWRDKVVRIMAEDRPVQLML